MNSVFVAFVALCTCLPPFVTPAADNDGGQNDDLGFMVGNRKHCTVQNTHGYLRTDILPAKKNNFVRAVFVPSEGVTEDRGKIVSAGDNVTVSFSLEIYHTRRHQWGPLAWSDLALHHSKKIHVVLVSADMGTFIHTHPVTHNTSATVFSVHIPLVLPQQYTVSIQFYFDTVAKNMCVHESHPHEHTSESNAIYMVAHAELPISVLDGDKSRTAFPRQPGNVWHTNVSVLPGADIASVALAKPDANQLQCCTGASLVSSQSFRTCVNVKMSIQTRNPDSNNVGWVSPNTVVPLPPVNGCLIFNFTLTWSQTGLPVQNLSKWLDAPAHILLARQSNDGIGRPDSLMHFHAIDQTVDETGAMVLTNMMCNGADHMHMNANHTHVGSSLAAVASGLVSPGAYSMFAVFAYNDSTNSDSHGLIIPRFSFQLGQISTLPVSQPVCESSNESKISRGTPSPTTSVLNNKTELPNSVVSHTGDIGIDPKMMFAIIFVAVLFILSSGFIVFRRRRKTAASVSVYVKHNILESPLPLTQPLPTID